MKYRILVFAFFIVLFYLIGAFISTEFNIAMWRELTRVLIAILGVFFGLMAATFPGLDDIFKK